MDVYKTPKDKVLWDKNNEGKVSTDAEEDRDVEYFSPHHTQGQMVDEFQKRAQASSTNQISQLIEEDSADDDFDYDDDTDANQKSESTGRWTKEEHDLFLEALKRYGKVKLYTGRSNLK